MKALLDLLDAAEVIPKPAPDSGTTTNGKLVADGDRAICEAIGLDVLGETGRDRVIRVFATYGRYRKTADIPKISRCAYEDLVQIAGPPVIERVYEPGPGVEAVPGMFSLRRVRQAIAMVAGRTRIPTAAWRGLGCWLGDGGETVFVGAGEAAVWDGVKLHRIDRPRAAGLFLDLSSSEDWYEFERIESYLMGMTAEWAHAQVEELVSICRRWRWRENHAEKDQDCPLVIAGLLLATWIQTAWTWRPMVVIKGESSTGKTLLFETLANVFGNLALLSSKSTEAGIRQAVGNKAVAIMCDEFESDKHRAKILELLRTSSRGSRQLRGTVNQDGQSTGLQHIGWVAAVEVGLDRAPDRNRFLDFELVPPPDHLRGKLQVPLLCDMRDLGQRLLAVAVYYQRRALELHETLKRERVPGVHPRVVESFAVPVSLLACLLPQSSPEAILTHLLGATEPDPETNKTDQEDLLEDIMGSVVRIGRGEEAVVSQLLSSTDPDKQAELERYGIALVSRRAGPRSCTEMQDVFLDPKGIRRLLAQSKWASQSIGQILRRLPGASERRCTIAYRQARGVTLSWGYVEKFYLQANEEDF